MRQLVDKDRQLWCVSMLVRLSAKTIGLNVLRSGACLRSEFDTRGPENGLPFKSPSVHGLERQSAKAES